MSSLEDIKHMKARVLTVMATRAQDQELVAQAAESMSTNANETSILAEDSTQITIIPSFGWHPWFSHHLYDESIYSENTSLTPSQITEHYQSVLSPPPSADFIATLPPPRSISSFLSSTAAHLSSHPLALVGEIGLDRGFRLPSGSPPSENAREEGLTPGGREGRPLSQHRVTIEHQKMVLQRQLRLAGEMRRAVSVHGVQAHGALHDAIAELWSDSKPKSKAKGKTKSPDEVRTPQPFPPRICLHSFSGPPETVKQYLRKDTPADIFFSFSTAVNFLPSPSGKVEDAIRAVPDDRILVESDLHIAGERMDDMLEDIVRKVCRLKTWGLEEGTRKLRDNYIRFILGRG